MSRIILSVSLASAIALSVVLPTQAAQPHCLTAELDPELVDSNLALSVGQCHLGRLVRGEAGPVRRLAALPRGGGGREEWMVGLVLVLGALASAVIEGPLNLQSLAWNAAALVLAVPPLLRVWRGVRAEAR